MRQKPAPAIIANKAQERTIMLRAIEELVIAVVFAALPIKLPRAIEMKAQTQAALRVSPAPRAQIERRLRQTFRPA